MEDEVEGMPSQAETKGSGASATSGGVAAGEGGNAAGRDNVIVRDSVIINANDPAFAPFDIRSFLKYKGPRTACGMGNPAKFWDTVLESSVGVENLRETLLDAAPEYVAELKDKPARFVSVDGFLYPCGLMVSGWWESHFPNTDGIEWNNGIKAWLFQGFHSWGPSFDFSWDFENPVMDSTRPYFVAQLGTGDEANSIPVIIPAEKAEKLRDIFRERGHEIEAGIAPLVVTVDGVLCHRSQCPDAALLGKVGGILDYCIWLKEGEPKHKISVGGRRADMYSAYLWKCLAPKNLLDQGKPLLLNDAYFLWEHTNLADEDSIKYNLDSLEHKATYLEQFHPDTKLVMLQKSNALVPGEPLWSKEQFYKYFLDKEEV